MNLGLRLLQELRRREEYGPKPTGNPKEIQKEICHPELYRVERELEWLRYNRLVYWDSPSYKRQNYALTKKGRALLKHADKINDLGITI